MDINEILKKLNGEIEPVGESCEDAERYDNLENMIDLTESLIDDIIWVARNKDKAEHSISKAGKRANKFIDYLKERLI